MTTDKELLQNGQFLIFDTPHRLATVMGTCVSVHPMQPRLHVTTNVTDLKGLCLGVHRVLLAINVEESNNQLVLLHVWQQWTHQHHGRQGRHASCSIRDG